MSSGSHAPVAVALLLAAPLPALPAMPAMPALAALAALTPPTLVFAAAPPAPAAGDVDADGVSFTKVQVNVGGELLDTRFVDMDGDGLTELVLAVRTRRPGEVSHREIHIHHRTADGVFDVAPNLVVPVLDDVIIYGVADVRDEPGNELLFLTRTGAFSYSPTLDGYRNNIRRLVTDDLLFQVPDERQLPGWSYVLPRGGRDLLLLPGTTSLALWGPRTTEEASGAQATAATAGDYSQRGSWGDAGKASLFSVKAPGAISVSSGGARISIDSSDSKSLFLGEAPAAFSAMLEADVRYRAPALADVNGDGLDDLILRENNSLRVALGTADGLAPDWSRSEPIPDWLDKPDSKLELTLADLDGDGDVDLLARSSPDSKRLQQVVFTYFVLINDGERLLPLEAQQVLRLEASGTRAEVTDVDHDGRPDLVLTKWTLPSVQDLVTGFNLQRGSFVYFASGRGSGPPFERKPSLRDEQSFTLDSLQDALVLRYISADCSGDGTADLVELDLSGRVAVRRILRERSLFGSGDWRIETDAWKRFDMGSSVEKLLLEDINGDGIADLVNPAETSLTLMISRRAEGPR